ncbi:response regulator [soil metagenome]
MNSSVYQAIIVEDQERSRDHLRFLLGERHDVQVLGEATSIAEAVSLCNTLHPNLIFLDIDLNGEDGFSLLEKLNPVPAIIFVTGFSEHAFRAFTVNAVDYLLKPADKDHLSDALERIHREPRRAQDLPYRVDDSMILRWDEQARRVYVENIAGIEADDNYTTVFLTDGTKLYIRRTISTWEEILPKELFCRADRSLMVNLKTIRHLTNKSRDQMTFTLDGHERLFEVGRTGVTNLRRSLRHLR